MTDEPKKKLGEILVARGLAAREEVAAVLASPGPGRLASELYRLGITAERELAQGLAEQHGHPAVVSPSRASTSRRSTWCRAPSASATTCCPSPSTPRR
ncbi:MAG: hypothetical protein A2138_15870 [Deltaproteobacteria bacterium RBG_16_71_12]|nr:MAG: hypothetical protein A2138_15870 [Deltaproteobacteria bacterium RBG_16_71_12]